MSAKRVLIIDDDAAIRETLERTLKRWSYDVSVAASAEEALAVLQRFDPAVVVTDIRMGGMDGLELLGILRERVPDIDVIVITAFEEMRTAVSAMKAGAFEYLVKPLDLDHIELVLQRCFADRALRQRVRRLADDASEAYTLDRIAGRSPGMIEIYKTIGQLARNHASVLIRGETGTGKELVARAIHFNSADAAEPIVAVNCSAIPESLLESELFGHRKGSFTGATMDRRGRFALAGRGTVFLDEIGDTSAAFQAKLLRVLQDQEFTPVGAERAERTEARVIAATHRDLESLMRSGAFREDLYFRLRIVEIRVPALRERRDDIPLLVDYFVRKIAGMLHQPPAAVTPAAMQGMIEYDWPGNVRELENTLTRALVLSKGSVIDVGDLSLASKTHFGGAIMEERPRGDSLREAEREQVVRVLAKTGGNKRKAARLLGISRARLDRLIVRHALHEDGVESRPPVDPDGLASSLSEA